jgi:hypothetical protein
VALCSFNVLAEEGGEKTLLQLRVEEGNVFKEWERALRKVVESLQSMAPEELLWFPRIRRERLLESNSKLGTSEGNFWNSSLISAQELLKYASHMDLLLLRSKNPIFYLHRLLMRSHFDHVGLLLKDDTERLFVLEAIQSKGVCLSSLESLLLTFGEEYEELAYRKLVVREGREGVKVEELENYINTVLGSKYELSITKLLLDNAPPLPPPHDAPQKTYFCSELVADIYLKFGILAEGKSNNFWPKDFEEDSMALSKDFKLGPLLQVQLDDPADSSEMS